MEVLLLREEMALHQRSRINWLLYGDKNSAFFHATINQRRQRNQVIKLKSSMGDWIEDDEGINELIKDFFSNLFTYSGRRDFSETLLSLKQTLSHRVDSLTLSKALQIPPDHARLIVDTIAVVHYSDCDIEAGGGVDVCFLILFLYVQSYKRLLPRTHKDSAAMADMWPSTSSFELDFLCAPSAGALFEVSNSGVANRHHRDQCAASASSSLTTCSSAEALLDVSGARAFNVSVASTGWFCSGSSSGMRRERSFIIEEEDESVG
ncbi:hypothetical protein RHGRI_034099 [Rhododendron griersonianum]|uniref:Uncharacterized protein n=1 Tax=Rhododendron griersonianum TaxID=479676 RepID=A0AAV6HZ73_9ERIC|nr:hypothetical protein RHGRI_034099 [Rhododendron griersonianum]